MVERFNAMLCRDLAKFVTHEEDWDRHLVFAALRYNATTNEAIVISLFRALFVVDPFGFDACLGLKLRLEDEPHDVAQRLAKVHGQFYKKAMRNRAAAQVQYEKAVKMCSSAVGYRVLIYHTPGETV
jgi:predicted RNA polymerase sigma factor